MKILRFFFYILLGLFLVFLLVGIVKPTISYESEVTIGADIHKSWSVFTDSSRIAEWVPGVQSITAIEKSPDGADRFEIVVVDNGTTYRMIETVVERIEQEKYVFDIESDVLIQRVEFDFSPNGEETLVRASESLEGKGLLMKPIFVFMQGMLHDVQEETLNNLKLTVESS